MCSFCPLFPFAAWKSGAACLDVNPMGQFHFRRLFLSLPFPVRFASHHSTLAPILSLGHGSRWQTEPRWKRYVLQFVEVPVAVLLMLVCSTYSLAPGIFEYQQNKSLITAPSSASTSPRTPQSLAGCPTGCPSPSCPGSYACSRSGSCRQPSSSRSETETSRPRATKTNSTHTTISDPSRAPTYRAFTARRPSTRARRHAGGGGGGGVPPVPPRPRRGRGDGHRGGALHSYVCWPAILTCLVRWGVLTWC